MNEKSRQSVRKQQRGAALLELAILLPLLIILLFGFVEFGRALLQTNTLNKAISIGARYIARIPDAVAVTTDSDGKVTACATGSQWSGATTNAELLIENSSAGTGAIILAGLEATFSNPEWRELPGLDEAICVVSVQATAPFLPILGDSLVPFFEVGPITLHAQAEERYIGE